MEYGIRYYKAQLDDDTYILIPINLVEGYSVGEKFFSERIYTYPQTKEDYRENRVVVDSLITDDELKYIYEMEDISFLKDYYFNEEKDQVIIVETKGNKIIKRKFNLDIVKSKRQVFLTFCF